MDDELFQLLQIEETRNALRTALIQTYFASEYHPAILKQGSINLQSYMYSQELIEKAQHQAKETESDEDHYQVNIRDQGWPQCSGCGTYRTVEHQP